MAHRLQSRDAATAALLAERYGTHRPGQRRTLLVVVAVVAAVFLGWLGWVAWHHGTPGIRGGLVSFTIDNQRQTTARIQIRLDGATSGTCLLRATAVDHFVVGEVNARITRAGTQQVTIRTEREAASVELISCTRTS